MKIIFQFIFVIVVFVSIVEMRPQCGKTPDPSQYRTVKGRNVFELVACVAKCYSNNWITYPLPKCQFDCLEKNGKKKTK